MWYWLLLVVLAHNFVDSNLLLSTSNTSQLLRPLLIDLLLYPFVVMDLRECIHFCRFYGELVIGMVGLILSDNAVSHLGCAYG